MSLTDMLLEEDARPMGASAMRAALNPNVGDYQWEGQGYEQVNPYPTHIPALAVHGYQGGSYPTGLAAVAPRGCRGCMQPVASPLSVHGYEGGSIATGLAAAMPSYEYGQLTPGGSYGTGLAAMRPAMAAACAPINMQSSRAAAIAYARCQLCNLSSSWCQATDQAVADHIAQDPTLFVCPDSARCIIAPATCTNCPTPEIIPGVPNTYLYIAGGGLVLLLVVAVVAKNLRPRHAAAPAPAGR